MGMIYKVVEDSNLQSDAMTIAKTLGDMPTKAMGLTKRLLNKSLTNSLEQQLEYEADVQVQATLTHDYTEGVNSFLEKRKPNFKGE
jgi:2-(1,2-epoxy-1,2-dihydrophenyl)acetyl-CoA isomerase